jgi:CHAD domain-containing protein
MLALLDGDEYGRFAKEFERFLETPGAGAGAPADQEATQPRRVRQAMPALVVAGYAAVRAYEDWVTGGNPPLPRFHELRIAEKRLRYTLEFFREVLPSGAGLLIERITELQDHLGNRQDAVVACEILRHFFAWGTWGAHRSGGHEASPANVAQGVAIYLAARHAAIRALADGLPAVWAKVADAAFRRRFFAVVSAL